MLELEKMKNKMKMIIMMVLMMLMMTATTVTVVKSIAVFSICPQGDRGAIACLVNDKKEAG